MTSTNKPHYYAFYFFVLFLLSGCVIPVDMFFRNRSDTVVRIKGKLLTRKYFDRLPNRVSFYNFPSTKRNVCGVWQQDQLIQWIDTTEFFLDVPPNTIVDLENVTDRFALGLSFPKIILTAVTKDKIDTISKGYYDVPVTTKFKVQRRFLGTYTLYYDFEK